MSGTVYILDALEIEYNIQAVIHLAVFNKKPDIEDILAVTPAHFNFTVDHLKHVLEKGYADSGMYSMNLVERGVIIVK